jgi:IclR family acetate operon transcriptional repressor
MNVELIDPNEVRGMIPRTVAVLRSFGGVQRDLGVSDVQRRTGLPKATVHRTLHELQKAGLLEKAGSGFRPGLLLFELGQLQSTAQQLRSLAAPHLEILSRRAHATAAVAVLDGTECVYLHVVSPLGPHQSPRRAAYHQGQRSAGEHQSPRPAGSRWPAHASCSGKILLASLDSLTSDLPPALPRLTSRTTTSPVILMRELERIRSTGIAYDHEESAPGLSGIAVPITTPTGDVVAAISVSRPTTDRWESTTESLLRQAAASVNEALRETALRRAGPH